MKKRRELDALVSGVKSRRKTSKSGHELLRYNGSESSDGDDFALTGPKTRGTSICSTCSSVFVFLLLVACLLVCAGLTWMHVEMKKDFEALRQGLAAVESRKSINGEDIQKLFLQLELANKTLDQHGKLFGTVSSDVTRFNASIQKLSESMERLDNSIKAAPELRLMPEKLDTVAKSVADLGSDVAGMKDTVSMVDPFIKDARARLDNLTSQISNIKQSMSAYSAPTQNTDLSPELANMVQNLPDQLQLINTTVSSQLAVVMKSLSTFEDRFVELHNITDRLTKNMSAILNDHSTITTDHSTMTGGETGGSLVDINSDQFKTSVTDILQSMLSALRSNTSDMPNDAADTDGVQSPSSSMTDSLQQQIDQLQQSVTQLLEQATSLEKVNVTVEKMKQDLTHFTSIVVDQAKKVANLSHYLTAIQNYVLRLEQNIQSSKDASLDLITPSPRSDDLPVEGGKIDEDSLVDKADVTEDIPVDLPVAGNDLSEGDQTAVSSLNTSTPAKQTGTSTQATTPAPVKIDFIKNGDKLDQYFLRWDQKGEGKIKYDVLPGFLGPHTPSEEDLKKFDENHDGYYSLQEMAHALGFTLAATNPPTTTVTSAP